MAVVPTKMNCAAIVLYYFTNELATNLIRRDVLASSTLRTRRTMGQNYLDVWKTYLTNNYSSITTPI